MAATTADPSSPSTSPSTSQASRHPWPQLNGVETGAPPSGVPPSPSSPSLVVAIPDLDISDRSLQEASPEDASRTSSGAAQVQQPFVRYATAGLARMDCSDSSNALLPICPLGFLHRMLIGFAARGKIMKKFHLWYETTASYLTGGAHIFSMNKAPLINFELKHQVWRQYVFNYSPSAECTSLDI